MSLTNKEGDLVVVNEFNRPVKIPTAYGQFQPGTVLSKKIVTRGLIGYWALSEPASSSGANTTNWFRDRSTNVGSTVSKTSHGTKTGTTTNSYISFGIQGLYFSGDDNVDIANQAYFSYEKDKPFSIDLWSKGINTSGNPRLITKQNTGSGAGWNFRSAGGSAFIQLNDVSANSTQVGEDCGATSGSFYYDGWYHWAVTYDGTGYAGFKIYQDGRQIPTATNSGVLAASMINSAPVVIGAMGSTSSSRTDYWSGSLADVKLYSVVLTPLEVLQNYRVGVPDIVTRGLISWWRFDGNPTHNSANSSGWWKDRAYELTGVGANPGNHLTKNGTSSRVEGPIGGQGALVFNGSSNYLTVANTSSLYPGSEFSISYWMYKSATSSADQRIVQYGGTSAGGYQAYISVDNIPRLAVYSASDANVLAASAAHATGSWKHYCWTWKQSGNIKVYVDGVQDNSASTTITPTNPSAAFYIGQSGSSTAYYTGNLDDVSFYNKELTATEVKNLFLAYR